MSGCIFCDIIAGRLPARKVHEDELAVAFWDARPASPIHILIVPRMHVPTFNDIPDHDPLLSHLGQVARKIAKELGVADSGYRLFINVNHGGGQVVFHLHAHLVAGHDVGTFFIHTAIAGSVLWRRLTGLFRGNVGRLHRRLETITASGLRATTGPAGLLEKFRAIFTSRSSLSEK
jgi:histidine triad (HIT) family protein